MRSTSTFHSSALSTARFPASPILTSPPAISTSGQAMQEGHSDIFLPSMLAHLLSIHPSCPLDVRAHSGVRTAPGVPRAQERPQAATKDLDVGELLTDEAFDVWTWGAAGATDCDDFPDLLQPEPQTLRLLDERNRPECIGVVHSISSAGAPRRRQDVAGLIDAKRLAGDATSPRQLADEKTIPSHGERIRLAPRGQVKNFVPCPSVSRVHSPRRMRGECGGLQRGPEAQAINSLDQLRDRDLGGIEGYDRLLRLEAH